MKMLSKGRRAGMQNPSHSLGKTKPRPAAFEAEHLENRKLLTAVIATPDAVTYDTAVSGPLAPKPGHTFYVSGMDSQGNALSQWANASAITPYTTNDLVMNVSPLSQSYSPCCEASGGTLGANVLTNGITQTQTAAAPNAASPAIGDGGASDPSNNVNVVTGSSGTVPSFTYLLGTAGGATASATGYDLSEIDIISGHQDYNNRIYSLDVLVQPVGSASFFSLSGGRGFSLTVVPDGQGGTLLIDKGSAQLAIVNSVNGSPIATNVSAVKLVIPDADTEFREFVVTGQASASLPTLGAVVPTSVVANTAAGLPVVQWSRTSTNPDYFTILRSSTFNGTYSAVGTTLDPATFVDATALPSSTYFYRVQASNSVGGGISLPSPAATTLNFGATAYVFQNQLWQGTPSIIENLPQVNYNGSNRSAAFPLAPGFNANSFSIYTTGKITTDLAGTYTFVTDSDDDGYLYVNGQLVSGNPGTHVVQSPTTTVPIALAAHTSYNFVLLENQTGGRYVSNLEWQEPQGNGSAGPLTLIPATNLSPTPDVAPTPQQVTAQVSSPTAITLSWNNPSDVSSYGYVVERAWADSSGNPTTSFSVIGQAFSGPTTGGASGPATWGARRFVDTTALANTLYVYKVGVLMPGQTTATAFSTPTSAVALPAVDSVSLQNGILNIIAGSANDGLGLYLVNGNQIVVTEGATSGDISAITIFSAPASQVNSLYVSGNSSGYQSLNFTRNLSFPGTVTVTQMSDIWVYGTLSASQVSFVASGNIGVYASITTTGAISLDADSNNDQIGSVTVLAGVTVNSNGNPISVHSGGMTLSGTINSGAGNILYSISPALSVGTLLLNTVSSGTVAITQTTTSNVTLSGTAGNGITGSIILDFPSSIVTSAGLDTTAGNANLQIVAAALFTSGPMNVGSGVLTLDATNVTLGAAVNAGSVVIPSFAQVAVDGATMTVPGNITNAGSLIVGAGGIINCAGAINGGGSLTSGLPAGAGTVAYYRLEGTAGSAASGTGSIIDSSGNGLNGTPINSPVYSSSVPASSVPQNGNPDTTSMSFDGISQQGVDIPDSTAFQITKSLTLEAYIYALPALVTGEGQIIFRGDDRPGLDPYFLTRGHVSANTLSFVVTNESGQTAELDAPIPLNQWIHVAGTLDDATGQMGLYVNGVRVSSTITTVRPFGVLTGPNPEVGIGNLGRPIGGEPFSGLIDEARISNVALTPSQFLDAPQRSAGASLTAGSFSQSAINVGPTGVLSVAHSAPATINSTSSLSIAPGGKLDLANNTLMINYAGQNDPTAMIRAYLSSGLNGGAWNGTGIISSDAASNVTHTTAIGYADSADGLVALPANTVEVKYTLYGDTGLTGSVGFTDFMRMTQHFTTTSGATWGTGDFNYEGAVDSSDFNLLQPNYGQTLPAPAVTPTVAAPVTSVRPPRVTTVPPPSAPLVPVDNAAIPNFVPDVVNNSTKKTKIKSHAVKANHHKNPR